MTWGSVEKHVCRSLSTGRRVPWMKICTDVGGGEVCGGGGGVLSGQGWTLRRAVQRNLPANLYQPLVLVLFFARIRMYLSMVPPPTQNFVDLVSLAWTLVSTLPQTSTTQIMWIVTFGQPSRIWFLSYSPCPHATTTQEFLDFVNFSRASGIWVSATPKPLRRPTQNLVRLPELGG